MTLLSETDPWWLAWIVPVVAGVTAIGGALIWIGRVVLLPGIKQELHELLSEKFDEAHKEMDTRHAQNQRDIAQVRRMVEEGSRERKRLHEQMAEIQSDVAYLRGRSSGTFKRQ